MTQKEFVDAFADRIGEKKTRASYLLQTLSDMITDNISNGVDVKIGGLGKFSTVRVKSRNGVNPATGEKIVIPELTRAKFVPSTILKKQLNK